MDKINTREDAIHLLRGFRYHGLRLGLAGSFAKNKVKTSSDIDILLDCPNSEEWVEVLLKLQDYTYSNTDRNCYFIILQQLLEQNREQKK